MKVLYFHFLYTMIKSKPKMVLALVVFLLEAMDLALSTNIPTRNFELRVPSARPTVSDTYVCTAMKVDPDQVWPMGAIKQNRFNKREHTAVSYQNESFSSK